jgi:transcriptional regulator with XRE-family HTH domain
MILTSAQCRAARAWLNISQDDLAERAKVAKVTIALFEMDDRLPRDRTLEDIRRALENLGMGFTFDGARGSGLTASEAAKPLQRVRRKRGTAE